MKIILRPVERKDFKKILEWRNNPEVRRWMFSDKEVSCKKHEKFWEEFLKNKDKRAYIIVHNDVDYGVIRLEKRDNTAYEIGIIVDPKYQGKGIAKNALKLLADKIKETDIYISKFIARIKPDNIQSQKLFKKAGFKEKFVQYEREF